MSGSERRAFRTFINRRAPEVGWNGKVLHRELRAWASPGAICKCSGICSHCARRASGPTWRRSDSKRRRADRHKSISAKLHVWIGETETPVHLFVFTLGYSRRLWARAYPHERLDVLLDGHERAFRHFGGTPLTWPTPPSSYAPSPPTAAEESRGTAAVAAPGASSTHANNGGTSTA